MKKIIIFSSSSLIYGAERGLLNFVKAVKEEYKLVVVLPSSGPIEKRLKEACGDIVIKIFPQPVLMRSFSPFYYIKFIPLFAINIAYFIFYIRAKKIDIVCTNNLLLVSPAIAAKITKKAHFWFIREFFPQDFLNSALGRFMNKFSDFIICQSEFIKDRLFLTDKAKVVYEPLDIFEYRICASGQARSILGIPLDSVVIGIVSRIHPSKGQYELIRDMSDFLIKNKNVFIVIAGDITPCNLRNRLYRRKMRSFIAKRDLSNVRILGFRDDVNEIISLSDICVFPFRREEPFGIAVAEALSFGKMTFYPMVGGLKEVYAIYKKGRDFNIEEIIEAASNFKHSPNIEKQDIYIPDILSFQAYKSNILSLLGREI